MRAEGDAEVMDGDSSAVPSTIVVGQHTLDGVVRHGADGGLFAAKEPEVLVGIEVVVTNLEGEVVGHGVVVDVVREVVDVILRPGLLDGLIVIVEGRVGAGSKEQ